MGLRLYARGAPAWWPFQVATPWGLPPRPPRPLYQSVLMDNGLYRLHRGQRPPLDRWLELLLRAVHEARRRLAPRELIVVLPDWPGDPRVAVEAARHPLARRLCGLDGVRCAAVAHSEPGRPLGYARSAEELASLDTVSVLAAPLKLPCSRPTRSHRVETSTACQAAIAAQVCGVARSHGLPCHALGARLRPDHLRRLASLGATSLDTTSWTRPVSSAAASLVGRRSARNQAEREALFALALRHLLDAGAPLELPGDLPSTPAVNLLLQQQKKK